MLAGSTGKKHTVHHEARMARTIQHSQQHSYHLSAMMVTDNYIMVPSCMSNSQNIETVTCALTSLIKTICITIS